MLTGIDKSPFRQTDLANSIDHRLKLLLIHLKENGFPLGDIDPNNVNWADIRVSGHSQGGNKTYYIAKFRGVKFACMLGAPFDVNDTVSPGAPNIADWFKVDIDKTPVSQMGEFVTTEDDNYGSFHGGTEYIGLRYGFEAAETTQAPYFNAAGESIDGHAASVADPKLKSLRAKVCFR